MPAVLSWAKANLSAILLVVAIGFGVETCNQRDVSIAENALYKIRIAQSDSILKHNQELLKAAQALRDSATKAAVIADSAYAKAKRDVGKSVRTVFVPETTFVRDSTGKDSTANIDSTGVEMIPLTVHLAIIAKADADIARWKGVVLSDSNTIRILTKDNSDLRDREKTQAGRIEELQQNRKWLVAKGMFIGVAILKGAEVVLQAVKK